MTLNISELEGSDDVGCVTPMDCCLYSVRETSRMRDVLEFFWGMVGSRPIEWIAVACGILNVSLIIRRSIWNYPFGFAVVTLYFFIFWEYRLYSDALLQVYFFFIQFYGLYVWLNGRAYDGRVIVAPLGTGIFALYLGATAIVWLIVASLMAAYTNAAAPFWDAAVAALSVTAQFLLSRRYLQSWYLWIAVDVLAIGLFYTRGLEPTAALYVVFLGLAITGFFQWRRAAMKPLTT
ncbi:nicotinamide riboside transporter PnuC [Tritonibacter mobilis]|uniref:nicotinamide riboside transporter PnuC n=1 Tax=Tritonibacter mobilis TaxID=379347 RepID=UPI001C0837F7|nr:nicotinamide riboside transporter PnuC [Tritonibacter mobilis]MBU3033712.1 nicotinamide riboside transporter PnuC [Tritonibacter mobilis]WHQ84312.1 nicotinamide riboside transporter PnuC [Tritonibacter mobilis]